MLNGPVTELTTAATDAALAIVCAGLAVRFARRPGNDGPRARLWSWVFGLLAAGSALGAVAHGLALGDDVRWALWQPLYLSISLTVALVFVAAIRDGWGPSAARRLLPFALAAAAAFYAVTLVSGGAFGAFVLYEGVAMTVALAVYVGLAVSGRRPGAPLVAAGLALTLAAAAIQASNLSVTVVWPFDHNGLFHLVQVVAVVVMARGLQR